MPTSRSSEGPGGRDAEAHATPPLHRALGTFDLVLLNVSAIVGLRYLSIAAQMGPSSLALWLLGLTTFLIPAARTVLELGSRLPGEAGEKSGFWVCDESVTKFPRFSLPQRQPAFSRAIARRLSGPTWRHSTAPEHRRIFAVKPSNPAHPTLV